MQSEDISRIFFDKEEYLKRPFLEREDIFGKWDFKSDIGNTKKKKQFLENEDVFGKGRKTTDI